jgi:hypothetical protein
MDPGSPGSGGSVDGRGFSQTQTVQTNLFFLTTALFLFCCSAELSDFLLGSMYAQDWYEDDFVDKNAKGQKPEWRIK